MLSSWNRSLGSIAWVGRDPENSYCLPEASPVTRIGAVLT